MKLVTAIVNKEDSKAVCNELLKAKFYVTRLATTGGFLMAGNMTLMIGTEDERVDECIACISKCCKQRTEIVPGTASLGVGLESTMPIQVTVGGATVFVTNVERFEKL
ncbi:cyclic-di-AMP receptor [bacterium]|uniref:cyclic-di-AMP receptor n=1 Tax=Gemmiger sp. TaxID=2049027 RepID=UPI002A7EB663|nr:cyclic-di-AMP receptor [Gemmiger sp.]MCI5557256.1 cyclic-di-AMP receptor [bacterium]MCI6084519.1 cyclic-di-AMP receptor [bacterium]MCI6247974.1 cyclic-di-AMP receptor [bacterium]MCI6521011.1 cyclic-di-AMP receptor [bacterium]MCI6884867.1 cyclic-di-AMP receptor [bacterium]